MVYFGVGEYNKALHWLNKIINTNYDGLRQDIIRISKLINLIVHFELGNDDLLSYIYKSSVRFFTQQEKQYKFETVFLDYFKKIALSKRDSKQKETYIKFKEELEKVFKDPYEKNALEYFNGWCSNANAATLRQLGFKDNEDREKYIHQLCATFNTPWFKYFMSFDPTPYLKKLKCKVLALNGSKDVQVIASQNLPGIEAALKKSNIKNYEVKELPGLNHLFQTCKTCTVNEYGKLEETFSPAALDIITEWLNKNVK